ncbi:MAG: hypothetical protein IJG63_06490 [Oscillospiraceae bacterium]|nr:hypothetical protein [Oscillospiraceae bacterium]
MLEWIVSSSLLIAVVMAIRYICLGRISPAMQYALWGLVLIRLLLPFTVGESAISIENALRTGGGYAVSEPAAPTGFAYDAQPSEELPPTGGTAVAEDITPLLPYLWLTGTAALTLWFAAVNFSMYLRLRRDRVLFDTAGRLPVYIAENIDSPCIFGILRPAVYVTPVVAEDERTYFHAISHELAHYRHFDHIWALLRCAVLAMHWYNPLVWWAAIVSRRDAELFADDAVLRRIGDENRADYGRTLLSIASGSLHRSSILRCGTGMSIGGKSMKERIVMIAGQRKRAFVLAMAVLLTVLITAGCAFTGAPKERLDMDRGVFVTINAEDVYGLGMNMENSGGGVSHADGSSFKPGERIKLDNDDMGAGMQRFELTAYDQNEQIITRGKFNVMFTEDTRCEIELNENLKFELKVIDPPVPEQGEAEAAEEFRDDKATAFDLISKLVDGEPVDGTLLLCCVSALDPSDWAALEQRYADTDWWSPVWSTLNSASIGTDQRLRDEHMMRIFLSSDGAYSEGVAELIARQADADPAAFSAALSGLESPQREQIEKTLSITAEAE